ncbi:tyrosine-type recombinase/integrase [Nocardiopsis sp. LOL_012]|uniref:tyrosine-type recombinase/integrase n=1 Tax=Nocardiopsis sp. LOL_012 TaxID=3345409 RepID=UPI003A8AE538
MARVWIYDRQNDRAYRDALAKAKKDKRKPPGRWQVRWYDPAGKPKARIFARKGQAEAFETEIENQLAAGNYRDPAAGKVLVGAVADAWLKSKTDLEQGSRDLYRDHLDNHVLPRWGKTPVAAVTYEDVTTWVLELQGTSGVRSGRKPLGAATIRGVHLVLLSVMDWAVKTKKIGENPARGVPLPKLPPRSHVYLSHVEVERLALAAREDATLIRFLAYTGVRWSEASALTVGNLDLVTRRAQIKQAYKDNKGKLTMGAPKKGETRAVPVPSFLVPELRALVEGRSAEALVFTAPRGGPIWLRNWRPRAFKKAVKEAGLEDRKLTPHKLRHTAASLAIAAGADVYVVQTMLGHRKPSITLDTYGHLWPDRLDEVADALGAKRAEHLAKEDERSAA